MDATDVQRGAAYDKREGCGDFAGSAYRDAIEGNGVSRDVSDRSQSSFQALIA